MKSKLLALCLKSEQLEIEGINLVIKEMTAGDASKYENSLYKIVNGKVVYNTEEAKAKLFALTAHDENGDRMFDVTDIEQIKQIPAHVVDAVFQVASKLNGLEKNQKN